MTVIQSWALLFIILIITNTLFTFSDIEFWLIVILVGLAVPNLYGGENKS